VDRKILCPVLLILAVLALGSERARADELTVAGSSSSTTPVGITFASATFSGTTASGFVGFSNLGAYTLSGNPGVYNNSTLALQLVFTLPTGIAGGGISTFTANLFGTVNSLGNGGVSIVYSNSTQNFTFSDPTGSGSFTFTVNNVALNPAGTTGLSGFVSGGTFTPTSVPEPSGILLLGAGLLLTPLLKLKKV
jgi:hypothetical protein